MEITVRKKCDRMKYDVGMMSGCYWPCPVMVAVVAVGLKLRFGYCNVTFQGFTAVTMKNVVFWDIKA
jgi:hypothetical protein